MVRGDSVYIWFTSERYDYQHWGWHITVTARLEREPPPLPWLLDLEKTAATLATALACAHMAGAPIGEMEQVRLSVSGGVVGKVPSSQF